MSSHALVEPLIELLEQGDEADRCYTCQALAVIADKESVPHLIKSLKDEDVDVCIDAATALGKIACESAVDALIEAINYAPEVDAKIACAEALMQIGSDHCKEVLLTFVKDRPDTVIWDESDDWDGWWDLQLVAVRACGKLKITASVPLLASILDDDDEFSQDIENEVLSALGELGSEGEQELIKRCKSEHHTNRRRALMILTNSNSVLAKETVAQALNDPIATVRMAALEGLRKQQAKEHIATIISCIHDSDSQVRGLALDIIGDIENRIEVSKIVDIAILLANDSAFEVRTAAINILANKKAAGVLVELNDEFNNKLLMRLQSEEMPEVIATIELISLINNGFFDQALATLINNHETFAPVTRSAVVALAKRVALSKRVSLAEKSPTTLQNLFELVSATRDPRAMVRSTAITQLKMLALQESNDDINEAAIETKTETIKTTDDNDIEVVFDPLLTSGSLAILISTLRGESLPEAPETTIELATAAQAQTTHDDKTTEKKLSTVNADIFVPPADELRIDVKDITPQQVNAQDAAYDKIISTMDEELPTSSQINETEDLEESASLSTIDAILADNARMEKAAADKLNPLKIKPVEELIDDLPEDMQEYGDTLRQALKKNEHAGIKKKRAYVNVESDTRQFAARMLAGFNQIEVLNVLVEMLTDFDEEVRRASAISIEQIIRINLPNLDTSVALGPLLNMIESNNASLRLVAIRALAVTNKNPFIGVILPLLTDEDSSVRVEALRGLASLMEFGCPDENFQDLLPQTSEVELHQAIKQSLHDKDCTVQREALKLYATITDQDSFEPLINLALKDGGNLARDVAHVMATIDADKSLAMVLTKLADASSSSVRRFLLAMIEIIFPLLSVTKGKA